MRGGGQRSTLRTSQSITRASSQEGAQSHVSPIAVPTPQPAVIHYGFTYMGKVVFLNALFGEVNTVGPFCIAALRSRVWEEMFANKFDTAPGSHFMVEASINIQGGLMLLKNDRYV